MFSMDTTIIELAESVKHDLELEGVHVHWDDARTTGSIYLDLDHEVLGSIRVSDHKSKGNGFKYEIGSHIRDAHIVEKEYMGATYQVQKFPDLRLGGLTEAVMIARLNLKARVGNTRYREAVDLNGRNYNERNVHPSRPRRKSRARAGD